MPRTSLVVSAAALVALVTGAVAAPAVADGGPTVTVTVQDARGTGLRWVNVNVLNKGGGGAWLGMTDESGQVTGSRDLASDEEIRPGSATVVATDQHPDRLDDHEQFAEGRQDVTITEEGDNSFVVVLSPGAKITGTVTAPSGRPVKNVAVATSGEDSGDLGHVDAKGAFTLAGLSPGRYRVEAGIRANRVDALRTDTTLGDVVVEDYGQVVGANVRNWRVRCDTGFSVTSPKKGQAKLSIKATAKSMGLTNPKGTIVVKRGSKTVKTIPWKSAKATTVLTKQPRGKKVSYSVAYQGGDCLGWKAAKKITIKK